MKANKQRRKHGCKQTNEKKKARYVSASAQTAQLKKVTPCSSQKHCS